MPFIGILPKPWVATLEPQSQPDWRTVGHSTPSRRGNGNEVLWRGQATDRKEYNGIETETETRFQHVMAEAG
jgi:hypothetical protein